MPQETAALSVLCLGTGRGSSAVYHGRASSAFVVLKHGRPVLLVDLGGGVTRACLGEVDYVPDTVLVTHNHSDHAAELPVVLAVETKHGRRLRVIAGREVGPLLERHRLAELASTGQPIEAFCELMTADAPVAIAARLSVELIRSRHAEPCYGFVLYDGNQPMLGYSGDSGYDRALYERVFAAPNVIVDARADGSAEHASFDEIAAFARDYPDRHLWITGYGGSDDAPASLQPLRPGDRVPLVQDTPC